MTELSSDLPASDHDGDATGVRAPGDSVPRLMSPPSHHRRRSPPTAANTRARSELLAILNETMDFLGRSAQAFDAGSEGEAKRLAVSLRVLLHDTSSSRSLLGQLRVKDKITFTDTCLPAESGGLMPSLGLVILRLASGEGGRYVSPSAEGVLSEDRASQPAVPFAEWWAATGLTLQDRGTSWRRRELVLLLANKEGGAHVDPDLDDAYDRLRHNGLGWEWVPEEGAEVPFEANAAAAAVRQMTFEVLDTLDRWSARIFGLRGPLPRMTQVIPER